MKIFCIKLFICFLFLFKTYIVGTRSNRLAEAVLTSAHNVYFGSKIRKVDIPLQTPYLLYKSGVTGVYISRTYFPDDCLRLPMSLSNPYATNGLSLAYQLNESTVILRGNQECLVISLYKIPLSKQNSHHVLRRHILG